MAWLFENEDQIFYETYGTLGGWITLINGYTRSGSDFRFLAQFLVKKGYRVLVLDNRGSGKTISRDSFTLEDCAADVKKIWAQEHIKETFLVGISMGGIISQILGAQESPTIKGLILVSTFSPAFQQSRKVTPWPQDIPSLEERLSHYLYEEVTNSRKLLIKAMAKEIHKKMNDGDFLEQAKRQDYAISKTSETSYQGHKIKVKTLILHGENDQVIPPEQADLLQKTIPHTEKVTFPLCGHFILVEKIKEFKEELLRFLSKC